jgi:pimeloyl-ACP methyl ester carboxylesterase
MTPSIDGEGVRLAYRETGSGAGVPVLARHGMASRARALAATRYRVTFVRS